MPTESLETFATDYYQRFAAAVAAFDKAPIQDVLNIFDQVSAAGGTLYLAGNGGSAGIADHSVCDISKGTYVEGQVPLRTVSLAANGPILTALGNDVSYDAVFSEQLKYYLTEKDALLVVSSSGNSPNVVNAVEYANAKGVPTIAFVGFKGGKLKEIARHVVHIAADNYGIVEDIHMSLIHCLTQYMKMRATA
ncbi:MAG: SIS domain-containing protein [Tateyamaria sp.]|uniref:SIS domain-containing protein n=1 Tax=Tateyamaria sp. TaxID=1929288 RepID=UPI00327B2C64